MPHGGTSQKELHISRWNNHPQFFQVASFSAPFKHRLNLKTCVSFLQVQDSVPPPCPPPLFPQLSLHLLPTSQRSLFVCLCRAVFTVLVSICLFNCIPHCDLCGLLGAKYCRWCSGWLELRRERFVCTHWLGCHSHRLTILHWTDQHTSTWHTMKVAALNSSLPEHRQQF